VCQSYRTVTGFHIIGNGDTATRATGSLPNGKTSNLPLSGVRVLELGQLIAGPFTGQLLGCVVAFPPLANILKLGAMGPYCWAAFVGISALRLSRSNPRVVEIRCACGANWMLTGRVLGFVAWRATRKA